MEVIEGFVRWSSVEDEQSFMEMCAPHINAPAELHQFVAWVQRVIEAHLEDGGEKQLYAAFLSAYLCQLPPTDLRTVISLHSEVAQRAVSNACSSPHEVSRLREFGNAGYLH